MGAEDGLDHSPMLLCPCGHNLCITCVETIEKKNRKNQCPYCRAKVEHRAVNRPLLELIITFATNTDGLSKKLYNNGQSNVVVSSNTSEEKNSQYYIGKYRSY